jgi:hypothetical protein
LAITTIYNPQYFLTTSKTILTEWLLDYIGNVDITFEMPYLEEQHGISRPILYLELMPGSDKPMGIGRVRNNTTRGNTYKIEFMSSFIVTNSVGGAPIVKELGENLYYNFLTNGHLLGAAKLKNAKCSTLREIPKGATEFFGGRHLITYEVEVYYTG